MSTHKALNSTISVFMIFSLLFNGTIRVSAQGGKNSVVAGSTNAMPASPTDQSKVPHYFGPYPNWANSPFTLPNATVTIQGNGSGATAVAQVDPVTQGIASIQVTTPGSGYTTANVVINGGNGNATATATINSTGIVTTVNMNAAGGGYTSPQVSFSGGGSPGTLVSVGNPLVARAYATDSVVPPTIVAASVTPVDTVTFNANIGSAIGGTFTLSVDAATTAAINWNAAAADVQLALEGALGAGAATVTGSGSSIDPWVIVFAAAPTTVTIDGANLTQPAAPALVPVFAIIPGAMPATGVVQQIQYFNQATAGGSPGPSAGNKFHAYILHPTGVANEYSVVWDSGEQTVPTTADPVGVTASIPVNPGVAVATGDVIAFYGAGIPYDMTATDIFSSPAPAAPIQGGTITLGSAGFPIAADARTYSFSAQVLNLTGVTPVTNATGTAYGSVDTVTIIDGGSGYTMPTVDFDLPDDPNGVQAKAHADMDANGTVIAVVVDDPGSGYLNAPGVAIHNGTLFDPIAGATLATVSSTLQITSVSLDTFGSGYVSTPTVSFSDRTGTGSGASATAVVDSGGITGISVTNGGSGYLTVGMRKFIDDLPGLCVPPSCPTTGKYIPLAVPEAKKYNGIEADEYVIGLIQYRTSFSSDLPPTLVRGYVQLETPANASISQHVPLRNELLNGTFVDTGYFGVTAPQWLGPIISATKDKPVRIVFHNLLPTGSDGDLFLPVDSSMMGSGMGPMNMMDPMNDGTVMDMVRNPACTEYPKGADCFKDNRATLHLHGGITPWISDGTPHQWITPAGENTPWPQGVSVSNVPDMNVCNAADDGCQTFYYTNQQSARLLFYHDHSWGITRLNVYAGEAAGYLISDATEQALLASGAIPADQIPLIVQDRTFVPDAAQLALQDPTWDAARWGTKGSFWYHHVYMPAQNPGDPSGMSAYGRWMYGPWFWPPAADTVYGPIDNPYYDPNCNLDNPATWQYQTDPFCEPKQIPGTPNISVGMEQFNDTPIVNGVAYPKVTLEPKAYRLRMLNAANDRFFNFQWYVADPTQGNGLTEVALKASELAAAQTDPNVFPTPDTTKSLPGPDWIQIGTEGGFLPAPAVIDGQQPTTWIIDPTRFDFGNVDKHSLLLAPAERADVIVDFSQFAGKTLILYNDAPAAFPARVASYDYYTGAPDLSPVGAPTTLPGYGPNTRTIMQVTIAGTPAPAFNLTKLRNAFKHNANGTGVFESGQHPIIVGQAAYNSAYGTAFAASSNCNAPNSTLQRCDGLVRVNDTATFGFNTLRSPTVKMTMPLQPKAIHDEMNATTFDEYGRMQANLGVEAQPPTPGQQNVTLYPYVNPSTELIDGTNLPKAHVVYDANGLPVSDVKVTPISNAIDGTQIWRITHNGVDTHPIHFHLYDVQLINRVTWDNIIMAPEANELGWKDTVRVSPLEDTIVAVRPVVPEVPFELPNSIRMLNPMMPAGSQAMFNNVLPNGNAPAANIVNQLVNFGWEYVYHCHILSHEEMDMMRPVSLVLPPNKPDGLVAGVNGLGQLDLTWNDNSINETSFLVQRTLDGVNWIDLGTVQSPLDQTNIHELRTYTDTTYQQGTAYQYRVVARNTAGYGAEFPTMTAQSISNPLTVGTEVPPAAPSALTVNLMPVALAQAPVKAQAKFLPALAQSGPQVQLQWKDNSLTEDGFTIERCAGVGCSDFAAIDGVGIGGTTYTDPAIAPNTSYSYRVIAFNAAGNSSASNVATIAIPAAPTVVSIMRASPNPTNAASVDYTVTFSAPVTGVGMSDFALTTTGGITGASVTGVTGTGATRTVTVSTGAGTGTLGLQVPDTAIITDLVGNQLAGLPFSTLNQEYIIYQTAPSVVSIVRASPNPTGASSVDYTVTFSEAVTGVDATDFAAAVTGNITNAYVISVSQPDPNQPIYTVTVNTGTGSGTLRLDLIDNDSIQNALTVPLGGLGAQNYTAGEVYDIDKIAPTVVSIARASADPTNAASVDFTVTFSEAVTGVNTSDFAPTVTGGITGASVANVSGSGTTYTVTVNTGSGSGSLRLDVPASAIVADLAGNPLGSLPFTSGEVYTVDKTAPTVVSVVRASVSPTTAASVNYTVTFSEAVTGVDAADFALTLTGITGASVANVSGSGTTYTVTVNTGTGYGALRLNLPASATVIDLAGNPLWNLPFTNGEFYTTLPIMGTGMYDDTSSGWVYSAGWTAVARTGPYNNTIHYTNTTNATASFTFQAPAYFTFYYAKFNNRGTFEIWVDGKLLTTINSYATTRTWQNPYISPLYTDNLPHTITIKNISTGGKQVDIDAIRINALPSPAGPNIYDDRNARWIYSVGWNTATPAGPYSNTIHYTNTTNATASFIFQGPAYFTFYYAKYTNRGAFEIWVDGKLLTTINPYATIRTWQNTYVSPLYTDNLPHTVVIKNISTGGKQVDVDAIRVNSIP